MLAPATVPARRATRTGQKRATVAPTSRAWNTCQTFATTTGSAMIATASCAGSTRHIIGTVSSGVPTPSVPLMVPPQKSASAHHATSGTSMPFNV